jgi:hypothetical protein
VKPLMMPSRGLTPRRCVDVGDGEPKEKDAGGTDVLNDGGDARECIPAVSCPPSTKFSSGSSPALVCG